MKFKLSFTTPVVAAISFCLLGGASPAAADILHVPGDYPTIQAGIDAAVNGDEVVVADGTYTGDGNRDLDFGGKLITVRSENGPDNCIMDCEGSQDDPHRGFHFHSGETNDAIVEGFTIRNGSVGNGWDSPDSFGGAIRCDASSPAITNCVITNNTAVDHYQARGGGIFCGDGASPTITNCTISGNLAVGFDDAGSGGGIYSSGGSPTIANCTISDNSAASGIGYGFGGGIRCGGGNPTIFNCTITGNSAGFGGGLSSSSATVINCSFIGNTATYRYGDGGGMKGGGTLINCTFSGNTAAYRGGGISSSSATVTNCILWEDSPNEIWGNPTVTFSDVQGGWRGEGNIDADPLFVDPDNGDLHLSPGSPCIDAADNTAVPKGIDTDLDGNPRFVDDPDTRDTGFGDPPIVDMGVYEFQALTCPWDLDSNGSVGASDLLLLLADWGNPYGAGDLLGLLASWGACP